ncbi:hypothetical protein Ahu01nite_033620 [Winogradskya humida]|uniref:Uncharacterized protein n=1 Tax=Winogradskya humida TaxID=113566 RepID=A0ABQ3ZNV3_9ACTN|nr:hypothetical protein Ahu01nite_033620 [Actinoplanes humidus]
MDSATDASERNCPGTGQKGNIEYQKGGDDWFVKCPVCGLTWAGGNHTVGPHEDWRTR